MDPILVVGADSVVGANLCVHWADKTEVVGVAESRLSIRGCEIISGGAGERDWDRLLGEHRPGTVVLCGPAAVSSWSSQCSSNLDDSLIQFVRGVSSAASRAGSRLAYISSDAVFSGPWMFHDEDSDSLCPSREAELLRAAEAEVLAQHERALVVRTNAFGWSPGGRQGWLETVLATIESRRSSALDPIRHATPILATDLADILEQALAIDLQGTYHVAGGERISPLNFAQKLAGQFNLPWVPIAREKAMVEPPRGFAVGECSLQTKKIRRDLCVAMPLLSESLDRLEAQQINGHRERLSPSASVQLRAA